MNLIKAGLWLSAATMGAIFAVPIHETLHCFDMGLPCTIEWESATFGNGAGSATGANPPDAPHWMITASASLFISVPLLAAVANLFSPKELLN